MDICWEALSAIGSTAGAAATAAATIFALYQSSQASRCKLECSLSLSPRRNNRRIAVLEIANTGFRAVSLRGVQCARRSDGSRMFKDAAMLFEVYPSIVQPGNVVISELDYGRFLSNERPSNILRKLATMVLCPIKMTVVDMAGNGHKVKVVRTGRKLLREAMAEMASERETMADMIHEIERIKNNDAMRGSEGN